METSRVAKVINKSGDTITLCNIRKIDMKKDEFPTVLVMVGKHCPGILVGYNNPVPFYKLFTPKQLQ